VRELVDIAFCVRQHVDAPADIALRLYQASPSAL